MERARDMYDILSQSDKKNLFEKQLQAFAKDVEILCALETGGKIEPNDAYKQIKLKWKKLKGLKKDLLPSQKQSTPKEEGEVLLDSQPYQ